MAGKKEEPITVFEKGLIYFFFRPKVEPAGKEEKPESLEDVQRLYMIMHPREPAGKFRLCVIGHKKMPAPGVRGHKRFWGFVDDVSGKPARIKEDTGGDIHATKTRGVEEQPAARPAAEGDYELLRHGDHTHIIFKLDLPRKPGPVQEELHIPEQASYIISVKNPEQPSPRGVGLRPKQKAEYPPDIMEKFGTRKFIDADPPRILDYPGTEFVLISASKNVRKELGIDIKTEDERTAEKELFKDLKIDRKERPLAPILTGAWE